MTSDKSNKQTIYYNNVTCHSMETDAFLQFRSVHHFTQSDKETVIMGIRLKLIGIVINIRQHSYSIGRVYLINTNNSCMMLLFSHSNHSTFHTLTIFK